MLNVYELEDPARSYMDKEDVSRCGKMRAVHRCGG
jgi:hypothetical protein